MIGLKKRKSSEKEAKDSSLSDQEPEQSEAETSADDASKKKKEPTTWKKILTRTATAVVLIFLYLCLIMSGHLYCILAMVITQTELYREIVNVRYVEAKERAMPWFRTLQWGWFYVPMIFVYGETLHKFCIEHKSLFYLTSITKHLPNLVFIMYCTLFIFSVLTLRSGLMRFQLSQFMWSIVTVCIVVFQCKLFATNTLKGLFWFWFPMAAVVMNDVSAYFCGITCGKRFIKAPFLALSPNKTWEGFIGAFFLTMVFSFYFPALLAQFSWLVCPADGLYIWPFPPSLTCEPNPVFILTKMNLPYIGEATLYPIQLHGLWYGLFASLVAPFGGFFASAIKRAYRLKDFDSFFPGHGGMMDRMDCQLLMITFNTFYYGNFIASKIQSVDKMLYYVSMMKPDDKLALWEEVCARVCIH
eukprot:gene24374-32819_t